MKQYRVRYFEDAIAALKEAAAFIEQRDGSERAGKWLHGMLDSVARLETLPSAHSRVSVLDGRSIYSTLVTPYRVYYVIEELSSTVYVLDIVHTARETRLRLYRTE